MQKLFILILTFSLMLAGVVFGADDNVFTYEVGDAEVSVFVEVRGEGNTSLLLNATDTQLKQYVPTGSYESEINAVFVKMGGRNILVDTGFGTNISANLKSLGVTPEQVNIVLLTHMHGDHIGGLQKDGKASFPNATVYVAELENNYWKDNAGVKTALAPYGKKVKTFKPGILGAKLKDLAPGIAPIAAYGHTPGHTVFLLTSRGSRILIWGDLVHASAIQYALPDISVTYDVDPAMAAAARKMFLKWMTENNVPAAGMHTLYPGMLTLTPAASGGYTAAYLK